MRMFDQRRGTRSSTRTHANAKTTGDEQPDDRRIQPSSASVSASSKEVSSAEQCRADGSSRDSV